MTQLVWPDGKKCAVALTFDVDGESSPIARDREHGHEKLTQISIASYEVSVGVPRILDSLKAYGIKSSFYIPGFNAELHPAMVESIVAGGHEIGHHGYLHERPDTLSDEEEEAVLVRGIESLQRLTGRKPVGYRSPAWELKPGSPGLLKRYGFKYDSSLMGSDFPYLVSTSDGDLLELPIQWILDDFPHFSVNHGGISSPQKVFEVWSSEFDGFHRFGGCYILTMHPFVTGRPSRIGLMERMIEYINGFDGVWWATLDEIANYALASGNCDTWTPPNLSPAAVSAAW